MYCESISLRGVRTHSGKCRFSQDTLPSMFFGMALVTQPLKCGVQCLVQPRDVVELGRNIRQELTTVRTLVFLLAHDFIFDALRDMLALRRHQLLDHLQRRSANASALIPQVEFLGKVPDVLKELWELLHNACSIFAIS